MTRLVHVTTVPHTLHFLVGQVAYMRQAGFDVHVVSSTGPKLDHFLELEPVSHTTIEMRRAISPWHDLFAVGRLWRAFRRLRPAIVHAHTPKAGLLAMLAASFSGVPVRIYHVHGLRFMTLRGWKRWIVTLSDRAAAALATQVLCVSESARQVAIDHAVVKPQRAKVLLKGSINGLDAEVRFNPARLPRGDRTNVRSRLGIPADAAVIGFVGRLVRDKGICELTTAWQSLRDEHPAAHLMLLGEFESEDPVPADIQHVLRSDPRVHVVDFDPDTPPLYAAMDVLCLPTYREGLPYVVLEASAMGLPVVATEVTGCVDAVEHGMTGTLVPPRHARRLAEALGDYLSNHGLRQWHGTAGRRRVLDEFQPRRMWQAMLGEYVRLLRLAGCPVPAAAGQGDEQRRVA